MLKDLNNRLNISLNNVLLVRVLARHLIVFSDSHNEAE